MSSAFVRCNTASASSGSSPSGTVLQLLKELHQLVGHIQEERTRSTENLANINKTHDKMKNENKVSSYFKNKLKGLYNAAIADAKVEGELIQQAMEKITDIKILRNEKRIVRSNASRQGYSGDEQRKPGMRRGVLMSMLHQAAVQLPVWNGRPGESAPPLCGSVSSDSAHICRQGDHVAARVKGPDGEEQWILAEVAAFNTSTQKYDVDDIDYTEEEGKAGQERHHLSKRRIIPLPLWKADPYTHNEAIFEPKQLVMALYPQTTCFYRALIHEPPQKADEDYSVLFEDTSYADGYSPPLNVPQRYVVQFRKR